MRRAPSQAREQPRVLEFVDLVIDHLTARGVMDPKSFDPSNLINRPS
jgi:hypothetical protein